MLVYGWSRSRLRMSPELRTEALKVWTRVFGGRGRWLLAWESWGGA